MSQLCVDRPLLLLDLLVLIVGTPKCAGDHDRNDGYKELIDGKSVLCSVLSHGFGLFSLM